MRPHPWREQPLRTAGLAVGTFIAAAWLALVEVFWLPLRVGTVLMPISIVAAVVGNLLLPPVALRLSGSRLVAVLPSLVWLVIALGASMRRPEGDLVIVGGGAAGAVNLTFLLLGVASAALGGARVLTRRTRPVPPAEEAEVSRPPAGSGTGGAR